MEIIPVLSRRVIMRIKQGTVHPAQSNSSILVSFIISLGLFSDRICWYTGCSSCVHRSSVCFTQPLPLLFSLPGMPFSSMCTWPFRCCRLHHAFPACRIIPPCLGSHRALAQDVCLGLQAFMYTSFVYAELLSIGLGAPVLLNSQWEPASCSVGRGLSRGRTTDRGTEESTAGPRK